MINENNAAQAAKPQTVLSFDERERILCQFIREPINHDREMAIAIETAVLSKLRAPVADERAALRQAVTLLLQVHPLLGPCDHELRDRIGAFLGKGGDA